MTKSEAKKVCRIICNLDDVYLGAADEGILQFINKFPCYESIADKVYWRYFGFNLDKKGLYESYSHKT